MLQAKYTVFLKTIMENPETKPLLEKAMSSYPLYQPRNELIYALIPSREELNTKILNSYKYREIGFETLGRFLEELETTLDEIMPYYNQLYKSVDIINGIDDIFGNVDITEMFEETTSGSSEGSSTGEGSSQGTASSDSNVKTDLKNNNKSVDSESPNGTIDIPATKIDSVNYADNIKWNEDISSSNTENKDLSNTSSTSTNKTNSNTKTNGKTSHTFKKIGNQGVNTYAHDMKEFRELFLNIEQQIINDIRIAELFMLVY